MIEVRVPESEEFAYEECEQLYKDNQEALEDDRDFNLLTKTTYFYAFHISATGELLGCIYYYPSGEHLFVNAFAYRGHSELNLECLKESLKWFECDIYAHALHRTSRLACLMAGFERLKGNYFIYRR